MSQPAAYTIRRSQRARRARLTITAEGDALVVLPVKADERLAAELVARHGRWLLRHQSRIRGQRTALAARPAVGLGRTIMLRGCETRIVVLEAPTSRPTVRHDAAAGALLVEGRDAAAQAARLVERWLRSEARRQLAAAIAVRGAQMGFWPNRLTVRDQRTRWGSASRRGTLSFSWRLVMCPAEVLDYVVVHELAHLRWAGHGPRFWALVRRHVPRADEHRRWLREHHALLRAALD
ncbi:MAG TPA: SprT family zinc-dependent metalloprotease [Candidatus Limnocylindrales bacterium]|nr:SprT family zinc-dependent metalloprotease [Candidatus Limnocylindrales bacterium]